MRRRKVLAGNSAPLIIPSNNRSEVIIDDPHHWEGDWVTSDVHLDPPTAVPVVAVVLTGVFRLSKDGAATVDYGPFTYTSGYYVFTFPDPTNIHSGLYSQYHDLNVQLQAAGDAITGAHGGTPNDDPDGVPDSWGYSVNGDSPGGGAVTPAVVGTVTSVVESAAILSKEHGFLRPA